MGSRHVLLQVETHTKMRGTIVVMRVLCPGNDPSALLRACRVTRWPWTASTISSGDTQHTKLKSGTLLACETEGLDLVDLGEPAAELCEIADRVAGFI